jgi:hypothetical protein
VQLQSRGAGYDRALHRPSARSRPFQVPGLDGEELLAADIGHNRGLWSEWLLDYYLYPSCLQLVRDVGRGLKAVESILPLGSKQLEEANRKHCSSGGVGALNIRFLIPCSLFLFIIATRN